MNLVTSNHTMYFWLHFPPLQAKFECALKHPGIKIVTLDWITDSVRGNVRAADPGHLCIRFTF